MDSLGNLSEVYSDCVLFEDVVTGRLVTPVFRKPLEEVLQEEEIEIDTEKSETDIEDEYVDEVEQTSIRVKFQFQFVDRKGKPLSDAEVVYQGEKYKLDSDGVLYLDLEDSQDSYEFEINHKGMRYDVKVGEVKGVTDVRVEVDVKGGFCWWCLVLVISFFMVGIFVVMKFGKSENKSKVINSVFVLLTTLALFCGGALLTVRDVSAWSYEDEPIWIGDIGTYTGDGVLRNPVDIFFDKEGHLYVADTYNHRIQKFDSEGNFLMKFGTQGSLEGQFSGPWGVAVDSNENIYVADTGNNRMQKFKKDGEYLGQWGQYGSSDGEFITPWGVEIDTDNNIYVSEWGNDRVQKFDADGNFILSWGGLGSLDGQLNNPSGLSIHNNEIYVSDRYNHRIQVFDLDGHFLRKMCSYGSAPGQLNQPRGIFVSDEFVYVADASNNRVQVLDLDGNSVLYFGSSGSGNGTFGNVGIRGVAVNSGGDIYVADAGNGLIQKFDSEGNFIKQWGRYIAGDGDFNNPMSVAFDSFNNIYVVERLGHKVQKFDSERNHLLSWGSFGTGESQFNSPCGIGIDKNNNVYVADRGNHRIQKFDMEGNFLTMWGGLGLGSGLFNFSGNNTHVGIDFDDECFVYISDQRNRLIQKFTEDGSFVRSGGGQVVEMDSLQVAMTDLVI